QCAALDIPTIPNGVVLVEEPPTNGGAFVVFAKHIRINKNNDQFKNIFAKAIDTVLHETSHWWQSCMIDEFYKGNIEEPHPDYAQIQLFALNDSRNRTDAYVSDGDAYKAQPKEKHAFDAGEGMSKALLERLPPKQLG